jgi:hypothetical protein
MTQLYNIDDDVVYFQADSTGSVARGTISAVSKVDTTYLYAFDNVQGSFYERMICGLYSAGASTLKSNANVLLGNLYDGIVAEINANFTEYSSSAETNIDALFA